MVRYSKQDVLNQDERKLILDNCKTFKEKFVIQTLMYTGMRVSELINMKRDWVKWQDDEIVIPKQEGDWKPKTAKGARTIPLMPQAREVLTKYFQDKSEVEMNRVTAWNIVKRVVSRIKPFKKCYPHALRATFASILANRGMDGAQLKYIMGWSKLETANNYIAAMNTKKDFMAKMEGVR